MTPAEPAESSEHAMVPLIISILVLVLVVFPIWASIKILSLSGKNDALEAKLRQLEAQVDELSEQQSYPATAPMRSTGVAEVSSPTIVVPPAAPVIEPVAA